MELIGIKRDELFDYLAGLDSPVSEYEILKRFTPAARDDGAPFSMFERHFSLYHALYLLKFHAGALGFYLHIDPLRVRLLPVPPRGRCGHYDPETGSFCTEEACGFCPAHDDGSERSLPSFDPMSGFYSDPENISFGESEILENVMRGFRLYCIHKREIDDALKLFGLRNPDRLKISLRYRKLAGEFHPDRCGGSGEKMKELNSSYAILKEVFVV